MYKWEDPELGQC